MMIDPIVMLKESDWHSTFLFLWFELFLFKISAMSLTVPTENLSAYSATVSEKLNLSLSELRRLFLVENMVDTIKVN